MRVLSIDTALEACAVAVLDTGNGKTTVESLPMVRGHAEALMPMIGRVMEKAGTGFSGLDRIAVTTGPGSFTGLRVGISAARGIALAADKPAVGLTTLAAFAAPLIAEDDKTAIAVAIDARHAHVYLHVFGAAGRTRVAPRIASIAEAVRASSSSGPVRLVGNGAAMLAAAWPASEPRPIKVEDMRAPDIVWVARLALAANDTPMPPKPLYLRSPDAQPQDAVRLPRR